MIRPPDAVEDGGGISVGGFWPGGIVRAIMATSRPVSLLRWRSDAVRRMRAARAATLAFVGRLPEPDALRPRTIDRWSVKDVLAHLMTCDEETVRRLKLIARGHSDRIHWFETMADGDRFNARSVSTRSAWRRYASVPRT